VVNLWYLFTFAAAASAVTRRASLAADPGGLRGNQ
jgi:hypothetical protein